FLGCPTPNASKGRRLGQAELLERPALRVRLNYRRWSRFHGSGIPNSRCATWTVESGDQHSTMSVFAAAFDDSFADPNLSREASWLAGGTGGPVPVRVILRRPDGLMDLGETRIRIATHRLDVRVSEVPLLAAGDIFLVDGIELRVQGAPERDSERLVWTAEA